ncbi:hypothetical protein DYB35_006256 [Aphanomyces astaci]|uniref:Phospholipid-transporting ATPase n=1 Tax=Aphanomyces astaci TaxID=112090 RepID=A0A418DPC6_APHAT|nr:hypothetical protein DYB35_006256 [Aphanomyces astaci]
MDVEPWLQNTRVKNVWPLRSLPLPASPFDIGGGPCARVASRVVSMELTEILTSPWSENVHPRRMYVHFYDSWADHVQHFVQHFKVSLAGHGLIQMEADTESSYEADTESAVVVVAERSLLSRCELMGQWSRDDTTMAIELKYQAATRANSASPIVYALEQVVTSATGTLDISDGHDDETTIPVHETFFTRVHRGGGDYSKATLTNRLADLVQNKQHLWCLCTYLVRGTDLRVAIVQTIWDVSLDSKGDQLIGMSHSTKNLGEYRKIYLNDAAKNAESAFCDNVVVTSKYTAVTFVPKFLFETFRKFANAYFLVVSMMQVIPSISNTNGLPSTAPTLLFIMVIDAIFAVLEDRKRHIADAVANSRVTRALAKEIEQFKAIEWKDLRVGDIVKLSNRDQVPADLVILAVAEQPSTPPTGLCYVETKSLDGETNMKVRQAIQCTMTKCQSPASLLALKGMIQCEHPNNGINTFQGVLHLDSGDKESIAHKSILLRGCTIRNTDWVLGLVVNTGQDTKIMMNNTSTPSKMSSMDVSINRYIVALVCVLFVCCAVGATGSVLWETKNSHTWYIHGKTPSQSSWLVMFFYFFLLMYQFIPISLYVSMTMVKHVQSMFLQWDVQMYHDDTDTPALVRTMSLNEELGQISYIFSDKTGTLTCNIMEFRKCSIGGVSYGHGTTEIGLAAQQRAANDDSFSAIAEEKHHSTKAKCVPYVNFDGAELYEHMAGSGGADQQERIHRFFLHLAICHTVIPEYRLGTTEVTLSASSPDEQALVSGAAFFGYEFINRIPGKVFIRVRGQEVLYELLDVLEFSSARKRMSTVVKTPDGDILVLTKGADVVVFERLKAQNNAPVVAHTTQHINSFAAEGLRTLTIASKQVDAAFYGEWSGRYHDALNNLEEIDKQKSELPNAIDECMEELETDLELLGATAIEDKLQTGVPATIATLAEAGIKIWVLTGDKEETAINIGFACNLLHSRMRRVVINSTLFDSAQKIEAELLSQVAVLCKEGSSADEFVDVALVIDGDSLIHALRGSCRTALLEFSQLCKAVIACRVSPGQKAEMVALIKDNIPGVRTLAIGDGANDVPMIQEAHVGVGISGQEGLQAVNASDYAIARFSFLGRLILVHGRWNYMRMSQLVLYMFYKNIMLTAAQYTYTWMSGFSGQKFFLESIVQLYNVLFTSYPILCLAILDQDVHDTMAVNFPKLYVAGPQNDLLNAAVFSAWVASALVESAAITLTVMWSFRDSSHSSESPGMWLVGNVVFSLVMVVVTIKLTLFQNSWLGINVVLYAISILLWISIATIASNWYLVSGWPWMDMMASMSCLVPSWCLLLFAPITFLLPTYVCKAIKSELYPEYNQLAMEVATFGLPLDLLTWNYAPSDRRQRLVHHKPNGNARKLSSVIPVSKRRSMTVKILSNDSQHSGFAFSSDNQARRAEAQLAIGKYIPHKAHHT